MFDIVPLRQLVFVIAIGFFSLLPPLFQFVQFSNVRKFSWGWILTDRVKILQDFVFLSVLLQVLDSSLMLQNATDLDLTAFVGVGLCVGSWEAIISSQIVETMAKD